MCVGGGGEAFGLHLPCVFRDVWLFFALHAEGVGHTNPMTLLSLPPLLSALSAFLSIVLSIFLVG